MVGTEDNLVAFSLEAASPLRPNWKSALTAQKKKHDLIQMSKSIKNAPVTDELFGGVYIIFVTNIEVTHICKCSEVGVAL